MSLSPDNVRMYVYMCATTKKFNSKSNKRKIHLKKIYSLF